LKGPDNLHLSAGFDNHGRGYLAYDVAVDFWDPLPGRHFEKPDEKVETKWGDFVDGYRSVSQFRQKALRPSWRRCDPSLCVQVQSNRTA
jgi:Ser/Thr protein kinase RdoA (MazF antagonist)